MLPDAADVEEVGYASSMSEHISLRLMSAADLDFADSLRSAAGWNQTRPDWQRLLNYQPDGCFVAELDGSPAGTASTTCYGTDLAWIGMVLVQPQFRRRGLGRALLLHCLDFLARKAIRCVKLDATPLGKTLYDQLGFRDEWALTRWQAEPLKPSAPDPSRSSQNPTPSSRCSLRRFQLSDADAIGRLDAMAFGLARPELLKTLAQDSSLALVCVARDGSMDGFGMMREGSRARYLGPVVANSSEVGIELLNELAAQSAGPSAYWDIPDGNAAARGVATSLGFTPQRPLLRMYRGPNDRPGNADHYFAIADPAIG